FDVWTVDEWDRMFSVNVKGAWLCAKAVVPHMAAQGKGKILNISSGTFQLGFAYLLPYVAGKGAIVAITRCLARELGEKGINVNCIAPGFTMSEASKKLASEAKGMAETVVGMQCIKRGEQTTDLLGAAVFLSSEDADFITGQTLLVDGGLVTQ
ncbi:MAG: SDR family oxidoreductase, partial [Methylococcaceae bacterium]